jgi:T5SS/PEP-CTERM-associated repeat protein
MTYQINFNGLGQAGNLSDPKNWAGGIVPGGANLAQITMSVGGPVNGTYSVGNMMLLGSEQITFTGTLDTTGNAALCQGLMVCVGAGAIFAPGAVLNDTGLLEVGKGATGTLMAEGSGIKHSVINSAVAVLGAKGNGVGTISIDDSTWNNRGDAVIGCVGKGTLDVTNGGSVNIGGSAYMAIAVGSSAAMNISTGGSVSVGGELRIGMSGTASIASVSVGSGSSLTVSKYLWVDTGSQLQLAGATVTSGATSGGFMVSAGGEISGFGTLASPDAAAVVDFGTIVASGGTLKIAESIVGAGGTLNIAANSTAMITGASIGIPNIAFIGSNATLSLAHGSSVSSTISGFGLSDMITMANITAVSFASNGKLTLSQNNVVVESLHLAGNFTGDTFALHQSAGIATITLQHN